MEDEKIILYSNHQIEISEVENDDTYMNVKFIICDFSVNKNGVQINRDTVDNWLDTLIMKPLVGLIKPNKDDEMDFTSHQAKKVYQLQNGKLQEKLKLGTEAFGVFDSVQIETIDEIEYITANARIWKRFEQCCQIIQDRFDNAEPLNTSWEISILENSITTIDGKQVKIIDEGIFIGHALLSKYTSPAFDCSRMLEVAEEETDELMQALIKDINNINQQESIQSENNSVENKLNENEGGNVIMAEQNKNTEISALTTADIRSKIANAIYATEGNGTYYWGIMVYPYEFVAYAHLDTKDSNEDDFVKFAYTVNSDDTISIVSKENVSMIFVPKTQNDTQIAELEKKLEVSSEELSSKVDEIVKLGEVINSQKEEITSHKEVIAQLEPIKLQMEQAETEKKEAEIAEQKESLKKMAISSKYFTEEDVEMSEELKQAIEELDVNQVKCLIAERVVEQASKEIVQTEVKVETSEKEIEVSTDLNAEQEYDYSKTGSVMLDVLKSKKKRRR